MPTVQEKPYDTTTSDNMKKRPKFTTWSVIHSPPRGVRFAGCLNTNPSSTGVTEQPPPPQSTTRAVDRPAAKAASIGAGARYREGASNRSKKSLK